MQRLAMLTALCFIGFMAPLTLALATPQLGVITPTSGVLIEGGTVAVTLDPHDFVIVSSPGPLTEIGQRPDLNRPGEGHVHLKLDLQPVMFWEQGVPQYTFSDVPAGEHLLTVELVNNDHSALVPPVTKTIRFSTAPALPRAGGGGMSPTDPRRVLALGGAIFALTVAGALALRRRYSRAL